MEDKRIPEESEFDESPWQPRPQWQVRMARAGLVLFLLFVIYQILTIAYGGFL